MLIHYCLLVSSKQGKSRRIPVGDQPVTVGRLSGTTISLDESAVSRKHCMITPTAGGLMLVDQGSTNGTFVNGIRRQHARLAHNDEIRVGTTVIRVQAQTSKDVGVMAAKSRDTLTPGVNCPLQLNQQLTLLIELTGRLARITDIPHTVEAVLDAITEAFPTERTLMILGRPIWREGGPLVYSLQGREDDAQTMDEVVIKRVVATGRPECRLPVRSKVVEPPPSASADLPVLCAPLKYEEKVLGVLYAEMRAEADWVDSQEVIALFSSVADLTSLALKHDLSEQARRTAGTVEGEPAPPLLGSSAEAYDIQIELAEKLAQIEHLQRARATMARGLFHDIKNLIGALHSNQSYIRQMLPVGSEEMEAMEDAEEIARRIVTMTEDMLTVSQLEEGELPLSTKAVSAVNVLERALRRHIAYAREYEIDLDTGPVVPGLSVIVDPKVFDRVLDNLLGNALRHAARGGRVRLSARFVSDQVEITVADSGPGVPPPDRERIFSEWYRASGRSGRHHGIGLYFCRLAAESLGGSIRVEGTPGDNRFIVSIPGILESKVGDETSQIKLTPAAARQALHRRTSGE